MTRFLFAAAATAVLLGPAAAAADGLHRRHHTGYGYRYAPVYGYAPLYRSAPVYGYSLRDPYRGTGDFAGRPSPYRAPEAIPVRAVRYSYTEHSGWIRLDHDLGHLPRPEPERRPAKRR